MLVNCSRVKLVIYLLLPIQCQQILQPCTERLSSLTSVSIFKKAHNSSPSSICTLGPISQEINKTYQYVFCSMGEHWRTCRKSWGEHTYYIQMFVLDKARTVCNSQLDGVANLLGFYLAAQANKLTECYDECHE